MSAKLKFWFRKKILDHFGCWKLAYKKNIWKGAYKLGHADPQIMLSSLRKRVWPIKGKGLAKKVVNACVKCFKANPVALQTLMSNRPRVSPSFPFTYTDIDFAEPFIIKYRRGRGWKTSKYYISVFVCFPRRLCTWNWYPIWQSMHLLLLCDALCRAVDSPQIFLPTTEPILSAQHF